MKQKYLKKETHAISPANHYDEFRPIYNNTWKEKKLKENARNLLSQPLRRAAPAVTAETDISRAALLEA